jgi:pimeloyl-ACP methyl ester carboxylesterase
MRRMHSAVVATFLAAGCTFTPSHFTSASLGTQGIVLWPCAPEGLARLARCGSARVFEDRHAGAGRALELRVIVVASADPNARPDPVVVFTGGPGLAATESVANPFFRRLFAPALQSRHFIFIDQRGTERGSALRCKLVGNDGDFGTIGGGGLPEVRLRECLAGNHANPELYTTSIAADDVDEIIGRLGYDTVDVAGFSYGTVLSQVFVRRHRARVRAMVLNGVSPLGVNFILRFAESSQHALDAVFRECAEDAACHAAFPDPGGDLDRARERLRAAPTRVAMNTSSGLETATLDADALAMAVRSLLYEPESRGRIPALLHAVAEGDDSVAGRSVTQSAEAISNEMSVGLYLSVTCSEDLQGVTGADADRAAAGSFLGTARIAPVLEACSYWPKGEVASDFHDPLRSDVPVLLLGGTRDPATPCEWMESMHATLPNAQTVLVPGGGHGVSEGCVPALFAQFLESPRSPLIASCVRTAQTTFVRALQSSL